MNTTNLIGIRTIGAIILLVICGITSRVHAQALPEFAPGQALVRIASGTYQGLTTQTTTQGVVTTSNPQLNALFSQVGVTKMERLHPLEENTQLGSSSGMNREYVLYFSSSLNVNQIVLQLQSDATIEVASPNYLHMVDITPNDPEFSQQWGVTKVSMPQAWDIQKGLASVRIAVLDAGFQLGHSDLTSKYSSFRRDETDINTQQYINNGWGLVSGEDYTVPDNDPTGTNSHGNWVSGVAGAATNNSIGIAGVGWNNQISPIRCGFELIRQGQRRGLFETDDWIRALDWVRNNNAGKVVNMSFGRAFSGGVDPFEQNAINAALNAGIVICASSGNSNVANVAYPAAYPGVIAIGASTTSDARASFSNYGDQLSLVAPGVGIRTTGGTNNYENVNGTSFASPHVAGTAALILSRNSNLSPSQVKSILETSATKVSAMGAQNFHPEYGYGRLNAHQALLNTPLSITVDQKLSNGQTFGSVSRWGGAGFVDFAALPAILIPQGQAERMRGQQSVSPSNEKYQRWTSSIENIPDVVNHRVFSTDKSATLISQFAPTQAGISLRNELIDAPNIMSGTIGFKDPWLIDFNDAPFGLRNRGMAAPFYERPSPFTPDFTTAYPVQSGSATHNGVFLNQDPQSSPTYYSARAQSTQSIGGYTGDFLGWSAVGASPSTPAALETPVVFTAPNAVVSARYKGRLLSSLAEASSQSGSQRRFARDVNAQSVYYLVYESAGKIWLTYTTNSGASWQPERFIEDGTRPSLAACDNGVAVAYTLTDGEDAEVRVRLFARSGNTLSQTAYHNNRTDWDAIPTASPAIVWLGNTNSTTMPSLNNLPRYAVVYEAPATQGGTHLRMFTIIGDLASPLPTTLSNSNVTLANVQLFPAIDAVIPSTNYSPLSVQARLVYCQRSGSEGWLRYQPLTFNFSSTSVSYVSISQGTAQTLNWTGSDKAELAGNYPTKPSIEVKSNITYIAFEVEGKNDIRYTTVNSSEQQGTVTIFSQTGDVLRAPSLHLQPNSTAPAIYFNMSSAVYEVRWTAQNNWHIQKVATDGEHTNIAVRSGIRRFVYTTNASAPFRLAFADGTTDGDAGSGGTQQERTVSGGGKGNTQSLLLNNGGGTSPSTALTTLERTTGVLSNQAESATLALTLADVGLNGSSRTGLTYHDLGANLLPDTLALSASNVFSLLKSRQFTLADTVNQMTATVKVHSKALYDLTQNNPVQLSVELFNVTTGNSLALSQTALVTASDTAKEIHFTMNLPTGQSGTDVELRVKVLGFAIQASHKASALNEIELVSGTGGAAIVNRVGGQATQSVGSVPTKFALHQNYPNPFNPVTVIRYELPEASAVKVQVFDVLGRAVATVVNERKEAGIYEAVFNASSLSSGTYFYRLEARSSGSQAGSFVETKKMVLVK